MVRVISKGPDKSVVKEVICRHCGAVLEYVPRDIKHKTYRDLTGSTDDYCWIECPECSTHIQVSER